VEGGNEGGGLREYVCADVVIKWPSPIWSLTETRGVIKDVRTKGCAYGERSGKDSGRL